MAAGGAAAEADGLSDVDFLDQRRGFEVGQRAGDPEDAIVAAGGKAQPLHRPGEELARGGLGLADAVEQLAFQHGVEPWPLHVEGFEPRRLDILGCRHPGRNLGRAFARHRQGEVLGTQGCHLDMQVDRRGRQFDFCSQP